jgi:glycosyltransferase involved in cell wall biosynthesis
MTTIRVLALMEAARVTGPAKNLIQFCRTVGELPEGPRIQVTVATFRRGVLKSERDGFRAALEESGIWTDVIEERSVFDVARQLSQLREIVGRRAPDIVQSHGVKSHFLLRLSGLPKSRPCVAFNHGYTVPDLKMRLYNQFDRWSLRMPGLIVTVSEAFRRDLISSGIRAEKIRVVHNAIDAEFLTAIAQVHRGRFRASLGIAEAEKIVLSAGRLSQEKAVPDLIRAAGLLRDLPVHIIVVGDGPEHANVKAAAAQAGIANRVRLMGHVKDVTPYFAVADVLALPSLSEGSPNALLEAMMAGVPVVATATGGIPEMVSNEVSALLVKPRDIEAMAHALRRVLTEPETSARLKTAAHELAVSGYSPEARAQALQKIYAEMAGAAANH